MSVRTVPYSHPDSAKLTVTAQLLSNVYLHREIREKVRESQLHPWSNGRCGRQGGAYGSRASHNLDGLFNFSSFR